VRERRRPGLSLKLSVVLATSVVAAMLLASWLAPGNAADARAWAASAVVVALASAFAFAVLLDWLVTRPLVRLARQVRATMAAGYTLPITPSGTDEPRELGEAIERLRADVVAERGRLRALNDELEDRVRARSEELAAAQRELGAAERLASVGRLAGGVAHEVNNPAGVILGRASFLLSVAEEEGFGAEVVEDLRVMERQARRISEITRGLLRFAHPGTGVRGPVELSDVARDAAALARIEAQARGVRLDTELDARSVHGDASALEQLAYNLVRNAVQAARSEVRVRTCGEGLVIEDDGPGIAPEHMPHLFDPFFTTKPPGQGTGLGLSVAHGIAQEHGGTLRAENRTEGGARFVLSLPR
jgi:two-component system NtrC family sensor kinase